MTDQAQPTAIDDVLWDLDPMLEGRTLEEQFAHARQLADVVVAQRDDLATFDAHGWAEFLRAVEDVHDAVARGASHAQLSQAVDMASPELSKAVAYVNEQAAALQRDMLFIELVWAELSDERVEELLADGALDAFAHHLRTLRKHKPFLLTEPEERLMAETHLTGTGAWRRLFDRLTSTITVDHPDAGEVPLSMALNGLMQPDRDVRDASADRISAALGKDLSTRTFIFNTLLADHATHDRIRGYPSWVSSRNLANEATDASVDALLEAVTGRYDLAHRWYALKGKLLGIDKLQDHDRYAPLATDATPISWGEAQTMVLDAYASFSPELADTARRFFDEKWIHAPIVPGKMGGAFCAYTSARHHPYVLVNFDGTRNDVLTLAHELGHGLHAMLSRDQGMHQQHTPLTLAETASVFGETVTFARLLEQVDDPSARLALIAQSIEGNIATVFRQASMNRFEHAIHTTRRTEGELSTEQFNEHWMRTQRAMFGDSLELTDRYATWWSYVTHFVAVPGYVYAYAYGQLLALSVYRQYRERGESFVPSYLELLASGGSRPPAELARMVDCDLEDPGFWDAGLAEIEAQIDLAESLA